ncbi:hypothetical protein pb186bvf_020927 [Paramecium bursaria]
MDLQIPFIIKQIQNCFVFNLRLIKTNKQKVMRFGASMIIGQSTKPNFLIKQLSKPRYEQKM